MKIQKKLLSLLIAAAMLAGISARPFAVASGWFTGSLSKVEQQVYGGFEKDLAALKATCSLGFSGESKEASAAFSKAFTLLKKQDPEFFWLGYSEQKCTLMPVSKTITWSPVFYPEFVKDGKLHTDLIKSSQAKIDKAAASVGKGKSTFETIRLMNNWLDKNVSYSYNYQEPRVFEITGAFIDRKSACTGFAKAFKYLCDQAGIDCVIVSGKGLTGGKTYDHDWCYVKMDNKKWYLLDPTWDNVSSNHEKWFLLGSNAVVEGLPLLKSHIPDDPSLYPELSESNYLS